MLLAVLLVVHFGLAATALAVVGELSLIPWRKARGARWTERARLLWSARTANGLFLIAAPVALAASQVLLFPQAPLAYLYAALAGIPGAILGMWPMTRAMFPDLRLGRWLRDLTIGYIIRLATLGVVVAAAIRMPYHLGWTAVAITAAVLAIKTWFICGGVLWLLRMVGVLVPAPERLTRVVGEVAARMAVPMPRVGLLRGHVANAVAFPLLQTLLVTEGALEALPDDELAGVCAHEFAHLNEPRNVLYARILAAFVSLPAIFAKPAFEAGGWIGCFLIYAAILLLSRLTTKLRHRMEKRADSMAAGHEGASAEVYARALERLHEINHLPAVLPGKRSHPDLYDRLLAAGVTPSYPRPAPPRRFTWQYWVAVLLFVASIFAAMGRFVEDVRKERRHALRMRR